MLKKIAVAMLITLSLSTVAPVAKADLEVPSCYPCSESPVPNSAR